MDGVWMENTATITRGHLLILKRSLESSRLKTEHPILKPGSWEPRQRSPSSHGATSRRGPGRNASGIKISASKYSIRRQGANTADHADRIGTATVRNCRGRPSLRPHRPGVVIGSPSRPDRKLSDFIARSSSSLRLHLPLAIALSPPSHLSSSPHHYPGGTRCSSFF